MTQQFYRLSDGWTEDGCVEVRLEKFDVLRETPCGYWLVPSWVKAGYFRQSDEYVEEFKRWAPKLGGRYCHPSVEQALDHYAIRKRHELRHIQARLDKCQRVRESWGQITAAAFDEDGYLNLGQPGGFFK